MLEQKGVYVVFKNNLALLEGLEFTPPSSARTKGDIYVPGTYTNMFFLIFRLMRYTYVFFFSLSGVRFCAAACFVSAIYVTVRVLSRICRPQENLSLLEGLEFTPPSSARTKGDLCRPQEKPLSAGRVRAHTSFEC